jgi:surface antigen
MTLNYIQDETEILMPGQELFINIDLEEAYKIGLKERPKVTTIPKVTKIAYTPVINKPSQGNKSSTTTNTSSITATTSNTSSKIIRQWVFNKPIKNKFYAGQCTWGVAVITPEIFPYIDEYTQARPFGGNGNQWYENARAA